METEKFFVNLLEILWIASAKTAVLYSSQFENYQKDTYDGYGSDILSRSEACFRS